MLSFPSEMPTRIFFSSDSWLTNEDLGSAICQKRHPCIGFLISMASSAPSFQLGIFSVLFFVLFYFFQLCVLPNTGLSFPKVPPWVTTDAAGDAAVADASKGARHSRNCGSTNGNIRPPPVLTRHCSCQRSRFPQSGNSLGLKTGGNQNPSA